jgi:hypothetical protein
MLSFTCFAQLKIGTGIQWISSGANVHVVLQDMNLVNEGALITGTGVFKFSGMQNSHISGSGLNGFNMLEIAKSNNAKLLLNCNVDVGSSINFISGQLDLNGNNVMLSSSGHIAGETEANRIVGTSGEVIITTELNAPQTVNAGNLGAVITSNANLGLVTIKRGHAAMSGAGLTNSVQRYYSISPANNTNLNATLRLNYFDAELNGQNEDFLVIWQLNPLFDGANWQNLSHSGRDASANYVQRAGINNLHLQTLANDNLISTDFKSQASKSFPSKSTFPQKKITVGPNPNSGHFWFSVTGIEKETIANLYTIDGKQIRQFQIVNLRQQAVNGLASGMYILRVPGFESQKIIVNAGINPSPKISQPKMDNSNL